ncbi:TBC domain containing protein [Tritrichomonas foetus]|uniref:TBC domain containing protein n=1 Tax=Tritrichomonas foetus TaxID=1144522 RepID=A0A1J4KM71_9EUKA|nr:TBC domain containing protein [Tritrichomonas foetus]|eukprot:OHT10469.1 TBC domain containing protein [Tritrichomonas foetus]
MTKSLMSRFSDFFQRIHPFFGENDHTIESPGRPEPVKTQSPPSPARIPITDPISHKPKFQHPKDKHIQKFTLLLSASVVDLDKVREISWVGIPNKYRARAWRLFLDYEPLGNEQAPSALRHKRKDYFDCMSRLFNDEQQALWTSSQKQTQHQISIDLPRTSITLLRNERVISLFQHVLFVWAVRHPASGYVQGMNDILQPFFFVFLMQYYPNMSADEIASKSDIDELSEDQKNDIEADCFWCFSRLLDGIQDVFTKDQPGLYRMIENLESVLQRAEPQLAKMIEEQNIPYTNFTIKWMNCLLVREFPLPLLFRIWDLFISDSSKIASTLVYICAAMLSNLSDSLLELQKMEFIVAIQSLQPEFWTPEKLETILALAFVYEKNYSLIASSLRYH